MKAIEWLGNRAKLLDQTQLPTKEVYLELGSYREIAAAIKALKIRGAPAIGVAGAYAVALGAFNIKASSKPDFIKELQNITREIASTRPTARNLPQALERMQQTAESAENVEQIKISLVNEAIAIHNEEAEATLKLSNLGADLIKDGSSILTHCNTGPLATAGHGTAEELELLCTHGVLHLLGYDHAEPDEHEEMFGLQAELLKSWREKRDQR